MNPKFIDYKALAKDIEKKIVSEFRIDFAESCMEEDEVLMSVNITDAADMINVCKLISRGELDRARNEMFSMDTLPRETLYNCIERVAGEGFFETV